MHKSNETHKVRSCIVLTTDVVGLFEFLNDHQFKFLKHFKIKELNVPSLWKNQNQRTINSGYLKNIQTCSSHKWTNKETTIFFADYLSFSTIKLRIMVTYQNWVFDFLEKIVPMNP